MAVPKKVRKKTAFVPRSLFATVVGVSVVPLCVSACGGNTTGMGRSSGSATGSSSAGSSGVQLTVAASGFFAVAQTGFSVSGVAFGGSGSGAASGGPSGSASGTAVSGIGFTVAASGFFSVASPAFDAGITTGGGADAGLDGARVPDGGDDGRAHDAKADAPLLLTVAVMGFDATTGPRDAGKG
jgi:hypothetical protein